MDGFHILTYHRPGPPDQPLVVFLPGGGHLARVSYGHDEASHRAYLDYWLQQRGYGFLGLSYPSTNVVFPDAHPELTIADWAINAARITARTIDAAGATPRVVLCGWSMGGRSALPFTVAARALGVEVDCFISLAASVPMLAWGPFPDDAAAVVDDTGLWDYSRDGRSGEQAYRAYYQQMTSQLAAGSPDLAVLSEHDYRAFYCGRHSIGLRGEIAVWNGTACVDSVDNYDAASGHGRWEDFPFSAAIVPTESSDPGSALAGPLRWTLVTAEKLARTLSRTDASRWQEIRYAVLDINTTLVRHVAGNHFFFVGERGARATTEAIAQLHTVTNELKSGMATPGL